MTSHFWLASIVALFLTMAQTQTSAPDALMKSVLADPTFTAAMSAIDRNHDAMIADIIAITEIPAPPFKETKRGDAILERFRALGLTDVNRDAAGNVMGLRKGTRGSGPLVLVNAHLDTVFPEGTDVRVKRQGTRLTAPGVGDNSRSLAVM